MGVEVNTSASTPSAFHLNKHLEGQCVDDGCKHSHLVSVHTVKALAYALKTAENVSAAVHYGYLKTGLCCRCHFLCIFFQPLGVKAFAGGAAQAFSGEWRV